MTIYPEVVIAGHICLDIIPSFFPQDVKHGELLHPGKLVNVGAATLATGGAVANTGIAMHRLGVPVRLLGKVGDDWFGRAILDRLQNESSELNTAMIIDAQVATSYSIVLNPPQVDRMFLHYPGANDSFQARDVDFTVLPCTKVFHFGYPPAMRQMYLDDGRDLASLFRAAKERGITTSLDMTQPDPESESGRVNWLKLLSHVLPYVDLFVPSLEEVLYMVYPEIWRQVRHAGGLDDWLAAEGAGLLTSLGERALELGAGVCGFKLGRHGFYLRTVSDASRIRGTVLDSGAGLDAWIGRELLRSCYQVDVTGTTGAGDCTVAGFLAGILWGFAPESAVEAAVAVGGCNVEAPDATSGVPDWQTIRARMDAGWPRQRIELNMPGWHLVDECSLAYGPMDRMRGKGHIVEP